MKPDDDNNGDNDDSNYNNYNYYSNLVITYKQIGLNISLWG
jgi:hypothetical protein